MKKNFVVIGMILLVSSCNVKLEKNSADYIDSLCGTEQYKQLNTLIETQKQSIVLCDSIINDKDSYSTEFYNKTVATRKVINREYQIDSMRLHVFIHWNSEFDSLELNNTRKMWENMIVNSK